MSRQLGILLGVILGTFLIVFVTIMLVGGERGAMSGMGDMAVDGTAAPPVAGYYAGEQIIFIHTEASSAEVAATLSEMMDSPVILVPRLAEVPEAARANVYVFTNGVKPEEEPAGPFGFQADVFDAVPGTEGYSPLRTVHLVTWEDEAEPEILRSLAEVERARDAGDLRIERTDVVVNMPVVNWPGGSR